MLRRVLGSIDQVLLMTSTLHLDAIDGFPQEIWINFYNASMRMSTLFILSAFSLSQAAAFMISYFNGKNEKENIWKTIKISFGAIIVLQIITYIIFLVIAPYMFYIFGISEILTSDILFSTIMVSYILFSIGTLFEATILISNSYYVSTKQPKLAIRMVILTRGVSFLTYITIFWLLQANSIIPQEYFFAFMMFNGITSFLIAVPLSFKRAKLESKKS